MDHGGVLTQIRGLIREKLNQLCGLADMVPGETMLIRNGCFCGRRFQCDGLEAVWFVEESQVKFYDRAGGILEVLEITPETLVAPDSKRDAA